MNIICVHNWPIENRLTVFRLACYIHIFHVSVCFALIEKKIIPLERQRICLSYTKSVRSTCHDFLVRLHKVWFIVTILCAVFGMSVRSLLLFSCQEGNKPIHCNWSEHPRFVKSAGSWSILSRGRLIELKACVELSGNTAHSCFNWAVTSDEHNLTSEYLSSDTKSPFSNTCKNSECFVTIRHHSCSTLTRHWSVQLAMGPSSNCGPNNLQCSLESLEKADENFHLFSCNSLTLLFHSSTTYHVIKLKGWVCWI